MKYAVIHKNKVINNVVWDGQSNWVYPFPHDELVENDDSHYSIGMELINGEWIMPEQEINDWEHPGSTMRIVVPKYLITAYPEMLFELAVRRKLPIEETEYAVRVYCNEILEQDQTLIDSLGGEIVVENLPN